MTRPASALGPRNLLTGVLEHWTAVIAAVGAAMYATVWLGYRLMYQAVGVSPEAVGLDQPAIVATTAVALTLTGAPVAVALVLGYGIAHWLGSDADAVGSLEELRGVAAGLAVAALLGPLGVVVLEFVPFLYEPPYMWFVLTAQVALGAVAGATILYLRGRTTVEAGVGRFLASLWVAAAIVALFAFSGFVVVRATELGRGVASGEPMVERRTYFFVLRSSPVCATVGDGAAEYLLYVGDDGERAVLVDPVDAVTIRRPLEGMTVSHLQPGGLSGRRGQAVTGEDRCADLAAPPNPLPARAPSPRSEGGYSSIAPWRSRRCWRNVRLGSVARARR